MLLHPLTNRWMPFYNAVKDILCWLIKTLPVYVWLNMSWWWRQILDFSVFQCFFPFAFSMYCQWKLVLFDNRTGDKIIIVLGALCFYSFNEATHLSHICFFFSFSYLETKLRQVHPALTKLWTWKFSSELFPYGHFKLERRWKYTIGTKN